MGVESLTYDVAVAGLGGMGSAVLAQCAARGARAIGIEQFDPVHDLGASSGKTRIIRQAYFEEAAYVPMLLRAYELWRELEREGGTQLLALCGLLMAGKPGSDVVAGSLHAAKVHGLSVDALEAADIRNRFPMLLVHDDEVGVYETQAGAIFPERAIAAYLDVASRCGADMRFRRKLERWESDAAGVVLALNDGERVRARTMVMTLGPWFAHELQRAGVTLTVQRNVQVWFTPSSGRYNAGAFPAFLIERDGLPAPLYGFPDFGDGVKAAFHGYGAVTPPEALTREVDPMRDVDPVARSLEAWMPGSAAAFRAGKACMYALTPDRHFVIDRHPLDERVVLCGGFSGHGFKFASVIGEIAAQLTLEGGTPHDIAFLNVRRFQQ